MKHSTHCRPIRQFLPPVNSPPSNSAPVSVFSPSRTVNINSINVPLCSEFCLMKLTDCLLLTAYLLAVFMSVFSVYSMFHHDGVCISCVSCNTRFTYLLIYFALWWSAVFRHSMSCTLQSRGIIYGAGRRKIVKERIPHHSIKSFPNASLYCGPTLYIM